MPEINADLTLNLERIKAFTSNEFELTLKASTTSAEPCWVEAVFEVPPPLTLAPDKPLTTGKSLVGIVSAGKAKEKKIKIYSGNDVYPDTYKIKATLYAYDADGAIAERKDFYRELECGEANAQVLQSP